VPVPHADPESSEKIDLQEAAVIARSLNDRMAFQLRSIIDRNLRAGHGWSDMTINHALRDRGLVEYTVSPVDYHRGNGDWRTRHQVTDVKPTQHAERVLLLWDVLSSGGDLRARPLGSSQAYVLRCLAEKNNGRWWPGCGWAWKNRSASVRILQSLADRDLAERGATTAGDAMFTITDAGRTRATSLTTRVLREIHARREQEGKNA